MYTHDDNWPCTKKKLWKILYVMYGVIVQQIHDLKYMLTLKYILTSFFTKIMPYNFVIHVLNLIK